MKKNLVPSTVEGSGYHRIFTYIIAHAVLRTRFGAWVSESLHVVGLEPENSTEKTDSINNTPLTHYNPKMMDFNLISRYSIMQ